MKIKRLLVCLTLSSVLFTSTVVFANRSSHESDLKSTVWAFGKLGAASVVIHNTASKLGLDATSKAVMHLSNVLVQSGVLFEKPVMTDLGFRAVLASTAASLASHPTMQANFAKVPMIGQDLVKAGPKGVGIVTVATYEMMKEAYNKCVDKLPRKMRSKIRGM